MVDESRPIQKQIYEHKRDLKKGIENNKLVLNNLETNHNFNFKDSKILVNLHNKKHRKSVDSSIISNYNSMKQRPGFSNLSSHLFKLVLKNYKIPYLR